MTILKTSDDSEVFCYYAAMECPICKQQLQLTGSDESNNPKTGAMYDRKVYVCENDDVWVTTEIPKTVS